MARWQETSQTPPEGKVVLDDGTIIKARGAMFGGWKAEGETGFSGEDLARKLQRRANKRKGGKGKSPDKWWDLKLW